MVHKRLDDSAVDLDGTEVRVRLFRNNRARQIILKIDAYDGDGEGDGVTVTLPRGAKPDEGLDLVRQNAHWVLEKLAELHPRIPFADGAVVPFRGVNYMIRHAPMERGVVWRDGLEIVVAGRAEHLGRRITDWFKREAKREIASRARQKARFLGRRVGRISVRDTRSRWGSCSVDGNMSFCWRLMMAPDPVLDYVIAHEVAHLVEANHGARFWRVVDTLTADADGPRKWLGVHGERLHRYG